MHLPLSSNVGGPGVAKCRDKVGVDVVRVIDMERVGQLDARGVVRVDVSVAVLVDVLSVQRRLPRILNKTNN